MVAPFALQSRTTGRARIRAIGATLPGGTPDAPRGSNAMSDFIFVCITVVFFFVAQAYTKACARL
jgi:hypothetical protein